MKTWQYGHLTELFNPPQRISLGLERHLAWAQEEGGLASPLVVSLSRIMKEPSMLPGARRWRSASFRLIPLKNHLSGVNEDNVRLMFLAIQSTAH